MFKIGDIVEYRYIKGTFGVVVGFGHTKHPITYHIDWFEHDAPAKICATYSAMDIVKVSQ